MGDKAAYRFSRGAGEFRKRDPSKLIGAAAASGKMHWKEPKQRTFPRSTLFPTQDCSDRIPSHTIHSRMLIETRSHINLDIMCTVNKSKSFILIDITVMFIIDTSQSTPMTSITMQHLSSTVAVM